MNVPADGTNLYEVLPEKIAAHLHASIRPIRTVAELRRATHRDVLIADNCGWGTLKQIQDALRGRGVEWPGYAIPYPKAKASGESSGQITVLGFVYLAQTATHSLTKVGFSRTADLRDIGPDGAEASLRAVHSMSAPASFQRWLHRMLSASRHRGEWFAMTTAEVEWFTTGAAYAQFITDETAVSGEDFTGLLPPKRLAAALGRHPNYVDAMKRCGFNMPGGMATLEEARAWLARNPPPRSRHSFRAAA